MKKKRLLALTLALLLLTACGGSPSPTGSVSPSPSGGTTESPGPSGSPTPSAAPSPSPTEGTEPPATTFTVAVTEELSALDPTVVYTAHGVTVTSHLFEGLMRWEAGEGTAGGLPLARLVPGQAERYERTMEEDGAVTYTFHLREDARWSDGLPVTGQDFVYAWQRLLTPATGATNAYLLLGVKNAADVRSGAKEPAQLGVAAPDDKTFTVTLEEECPGFLELCAFPVTYPLRQDVVEAEGGGWSTEPQKLVTNGPYTLAGWSRYSAMTLAPNEQYYREPAGAERLVFLYAPDDTRRLEYLDNGTVDFVADIPGEALSERLKDKDNTLPQTGVYYLQFQTKTAPFDQVLVRRAFTLAVDRAALLDGQEATAAGGLVPNGAYDQEGPDGNDFRTVGGDFYDPADTEANFAEARSLLRQAGYPDGEGFPEITYLYNDTEPHSTIAKKLKATWEKELGVTVTLKGESWPNYLYYLNAGQYSIAKNSWTADRTDPAGILELFDGDHAESWYEGEGLDSLLDRAGRIATPSARLPLLHQAENVLLERDQAVCPLYFYQRSYLAGEKVTGVYYLPTGYFFFSAAQRG